MREKERKRAQTQVRKFKERKFKEKKKMRKRKNAQKKKLVWNNQVWLPFKAFSKKIALLAQGGPGSVRFGYGLGMETVRAVPVFGSGGSSAKRGFLCFSTVLTGKDGSGSAFGFGKNGSDGSGFRVFFCHLC